MDFKFKELLRTWDEKFSIKSLKTKLREEK